MTKSAEFPKNRPFRPRLAGGMIARLLGLAVLAGVLYSGYHWFICRIEVGPNEMLIIVNKTGRDLPAELADEFGDQVVLYPALVDTIAAKTGRTADYVRENYKGVRYEVLGEGRHFFNPYDYLRRDGVQATIIGPDEVGVMIRRYGRPLPSPKTVATEPDERGPVAGELLPGKYNINPLAYDIQRFPAIEIPAGHVGVVTLLSGADPVEKNTWTVAPGEKGVQHDTLPPGLIFYNPYLKNVEIVDIRSQKYDMREEDAIQFPSKDSFTITMEGTIEWAIRPDRVAEVAVGYGDSTDILNKIILPYARSIARIQGSKLQAREFISGTTRREFQDRLMSELRNKCLEEGIEVKAALIRDIKPPAEIAGLISQRELAQQEIERSTNLMEDAKAEVLLVEQQEMESRNRLVGEARQSVVTVTQEAKKRQVTIVTQAEGELDVVRLELEAAKKEANAIVSRGEAEANVVRFDFQARAEPLQASVAAFGDGTTYAQHFFLGRIAPSIRSILSNTEGPFAEVFKQFQTFPTAPGATRTTAERTADNAGSPAGGVQ